MFVCLFVFMALGEMLNSFSWQVPYETCWLKFLYPEVFHVRKHEWDQNPVFIQSAVGYQFESFIILRVDALNKVSWELSWHCQIDFFTITSVLKWICCRVYFSVIWILQRKRFWTEGKWCVGDAGFSEYLKFVSCVHICRR